MARISSFIVPLAVVLVATGCPREEVRDCSAEARASVQIDVFDLEGNAIDDAFATYTVDGGAPSDCESVSGNTLICGWEREGEFVIDVDADGYAIETLTATVTSDICHVETQTLTAVLDYVACTDEEVPSVQVTVTDSQGTEITSADVVWNRAEEDDLPEPCDSVGGNVWYCAGEVAGDIRVEISNAGPYEPYSQVVTVGSDECHVITEDLDAVLQFLPD